MTCKSPVGDISAVTLIRTDTTLDHSQKAEKVYIALFTRVSELRDSRSWPCVPNNPKAAMTKTKELVRRLVFDHLNLGGRKAVAR